MDHSSCRCSIRVLLEVSHIVGSGCLADWLRDRENSGDRYFSSLELNSNRGSSCTRYRNRYDVHRVLLTSADLLASRTMAVASAGIGNSPLNSCCCYSARGNRSSEGPRSNETSRVVDVGSLHKSHSDLLNYFRNVARCHRQIVSWRRFLEMGLVSSRGYEHCQLARCVSRPRRVGRY